MLNVSVDDDDIIIKINKNALIYAAEHYSEHDVTITNEEDYIKYMVTCLPGFDYINDSDNPGTAFTRILDGILEQAIEDGEDFLEVEENC
jgi:hypothetical protein